MAFLSALKTSRKRYLMKFDSLMVMGALYRKYITNIVMTIINQIRVRHMSLIILASSMRIYLTGIS